MMKQIKQIIKAFDTNAKTYDKHSLMQQHIGHILLERLDLLAKKPMMILDLGGGTGYFSVLLRKKFPKACVVTLDLSDNMLREAKKKQGWFKKWPLVRSDMHQLPFKAGTFDLIFANQVLHWTTDMPALLKEWQRVLTKEGALFMSTLGTDTFKEIKQAFSTIDNYDHVNAYLDMHDVGDMLVRNGFTDPIVDMTYLYARFSSLTALFKSLKCQGVRLIHTNRVSGLMGPKKWMQFTQQMNILKEEEDAFLLTYEVVFAHAWKGTLPQKILDGKVHVSVDTLFKK